jgi:hypothetical protein
MRVIRIALVVAALALVAFLAVGLAYASIRSDDTRTAIATAQRFLEAACDPERGHGWDELDGGQRRARFGDAATYQALAAAAADCDNFTAQAFSAHCDDGACTVWFSVPDEASIPGFMADTGIVDYRTDHVPAGTNAAVGVSQRGPFGQGVSVPEE